MEKILTDNGITRVIVTGMAAQGAVLRTATVAGVHKMDVLPVDCLSADTPYVEQEAIHLLETGPGARKRIRPAVAT